MSSIDDDLRAGAPTVKFPAKGSSIRGTILTVPDKGQQTEIGTGKPLFWDDGQPKVQYIFQLATDERDGDVPDDDGTRRLFVKGRMWDAVRKAVNDAGGSGGWVGGTLVVKYSEDGKPSQAGFTAPKLYEAAYKPPTAAVDNDLTEARPSAADLL